MIYIGENQVVQIFLGDKEVIKVYLGEKELYSKSGEDSSKGPSVDPSKVI